ncbi:MAG: double-strand break repair helicase AddA [Gemmobacter sp.]
MTAPDDATLRQIAAADPARSTWVSANAGSGKTRVLTDRVARMLLDGVNPARILCLTYTKAAASEMQNRLFRRLGSWAMLPDDALRAALVDLGAGGALPAPRLARARTLFATAIETPGGLRIQTIHSFCASLLRRFPLEAGVSPRFAEMDDRAATLLRAAILEDLAETLAPEVMARVAAAYTGEDVAALAAEIAGRRMAFAPPLDDAAIRRRFGVPPGETDQTILSDVFGGDEADLLAAVTAVMATGSINDVKGADALALCDVDRPDLATLQRLEQVFLYGPTAKSPHGAKTDRFPTKATQAALGALLRPLHALMGRVAAARPRRIALMAADRTATLHAFAADFLPEYAARKAARGLLDFDDLILGARALLTDPGVAQWVLFRLDGGIDHILVDEAQDTSPVQWQVIEALAAEFTSGQGQRGAGRTLFVVGDRKQSIYSFQGADLRAFAAQETGFADRFAAAGTPLQQTGLSHSFRSSPVLLRLVDATFDAARGRALDQGSTHIAFWPDMPGRIELWPPFDKAQDPEPENWYDPVDLPTGAHHAVRLGTAIASHIKAMVTAQAPIPVGRALRPVTPGDVLILVRRRSEIFHAIIAACKAAGLPMAGSDRMRLGGELAVRDIAALLSFLTLPEDDLSLAAALRSPLFGWTEDALYRLAQPRTGTLWAALRADPQAPPDTLAMLDDLRAQADFLRPYEMIERILTRHDGRRRLIARLGDEAQDGIDEMLAQALAYERQAVPSLTGFLVWLDADAVEVKRPVEGAGGRIRVMTVHGAKGLEAPVVILPDTAAYRRRERDEVVIAEDGTPLWKTPADASPPLVAEARAARKAREDAESLRLLYVAMTRAQSRLIVAAAGDLGRETAEDEAAPPAWYHLIADGMAAAGAVPREGGGLELVHGNWASPLTLPPQAENRSHSVLPGWIGAQAATSPPATPALIPSQLGGAKALPGEAGLDEAASLAHGTALHRLLEQMPLQAPADWPLLLPQAGAPELIAEARAVLEDPRLSHLFGPGSLAEVPFAASIEGRQVTGTIDRLVVTPGRVLAVDFKSNRVVPTRAEDVPEGILRQMGAYALGLAQIWPDRPVEVAVLWTRGPVLMSLPPEIVRGAWARTTIP